MWYIGFVGRPFGGGLFPYAPSVPAIGIFYSLIVVFQVRFLDFVF